MQQSEGVEDAGTSQPGLSDILPGADGRSQLSQALQSTSHVPLRAISFTLQDGVVLLQGRVPTYYFKQLAQSIAKTIWQVEVIDNQIEVPRRST